MTPDPRRPEERQRPILARDADDVRDEDRNQLTDLRRGRAAAQRFAWAEAYESLSLADQVAPLATQDLHHLATAAYLLGHIPECVGALRRAYERHVEAGEARAAARSAFWIAYALGTQGDSAQAGAWLARANRLVEDEPECAEQALPLLPVAVRHRLAGELDQARELSGRAAEVGRRTGDADLRALAMCLYGGALVHQGRAAEGLALLDEAMLAVVSAEISPMAAGTVYCTVISICREIAELRRAQEWTEALAAWCSKQPDMVVFTGQCLVHRAALMRLHGEWPEALGEAQRACDRLARSPDAFATGAARYEQGELHRARGDFAAAEEAYRQASEWGYEPQPGLALLRMMQGRTAAASAAIRRALAEATDPVARAGLLPAEVEIALEGGEIPAARAAADELCRAAEEYATPALRATAGYAHGAVLLAEGDPSAALGALRAAGELWRDLDVPYEAARIRVQVGLGCRALGDEDGAALEFDAARRVFARLGAEPDRARVEALTRRKGGGSSHGLTPRELEVLRLVATGLTNQAIAAALVLSEKTVERHLSNLFAKLGVATRAAATAYAYQHELVPR